MKKIAVRPADRIKDLPPYLFAAIDQMKQEAIRQGKDIINLGVGDPDMPTPAAIIERMKKAVENPRHHQYPTYDGMSSFRQAVADWYRRRFNASLDPETEILSLIGSKEGIGHLPFALIRLRNWTANCSVPWPPEYGEITAAGFECIFPIVEAEFASSRLS